MVTAFCVAGLGLGKVLDEVVWQVSYDYVFAPKLFARRGGLVGMLEGAVVAATYVFWPCSDGNRIALRSAAFTFLAAALSGIVFAGFSGVLLKAGVLQAVELATPTRTTVCIAAVWGTFFGSVGATVVSIFRIRLQNPHNRIAKGHRL